jgi:oxygen-dependent protoporphyrinogen oxidase
VPRLVVVGGGISGLAAAWTARRRAAALGSPLDVTLLDRGDAVGGKARSFADGGWLVEGGPGGFIGGSPELSALLAEAGLSGEALPATAAAARRFIYRRGRLREVAFHPLKMLASGLLTPAGLARLLAEPFIAARPDDGDESVFDFAARRLGAQAAERLIAPMTLGVFAGDARRLSLPAAFPRMAALEREHGSLIRGLIARRGKTARGSLTSFAAGMQTLPRVLADRGGFEIRTRSAVRALARGDGRWQVQVDGTAPIAADQVILAGEPFAIGDLLAPLAPDAARELAAIPCPPVSVVALGYPMPGAPRVPRGFGVLISRGEGIRALGHLWDTHLFPGRSPDGHLLVRAMYGGAADPLAGELDDEALLALARAEAQRLYGITAAPVFAKVVRWASAIPQYELGHRERVARIEQAVAALGGIELAGSGLRGVAFADAAASGVRAAERVLARM